MRKALFLQSNHANEPPEQLFSLKAANQITTVFHIHFISCQTIPRDTF